MTLSELSECHDHLLVSTQPETENKEKLRGPWQDHTSSVQVQFVTKVVGCIEHTSQIRTYGNVMLEAKGVQGEQGMSEDGVAMWDGERVLPTSV